MTNSENNLNLQFRKSNRQCWGSNRAFRIWSFEILLSFVISHSDFA